MKRETIMSQSTKFEKGVLVGKAASARKPSPRIVNQPYPGRIESARRRPNDTNYGTVGGRVQ
jgi:hypothetical protein